MAMVKIRDLLRQRGIGCLVYGPAHSGKTWALASLAKKWPGKIFTCETNGLRTLLNAGVENVDVTVIKNAKEWDVAVGAYINQCPATDQWVAFDTITSYYDLLWNEFFVDEKVDAKAIGFQIYGYCKNQFEQFFAKTLDLVEMGKHVFLLCHQQTESEEGPGSKASWSAPDLPGKLPDRLVRRLDLVLMARRIPVGDGVRFKFLPPGARDYGKDLFGVTRDGPIDNNLAAVVERCVAIAASQNGDREVPDPIGELCDDKLVEKQMHSSPAKKRGRPPKLTVIERTTSSAPAPAPLPPPVTAAPEHPPVPAPTDTKVALVNPHISRERVIMLYGDASKAGWDGTKLRSEMKARYGVERIELLTDDQYSEFFLAIQELAPWMDGDGEAAPQEASA